MIDIAAKKGDIIVLENYNWGIISITSTNESILQLLSRTDVPPEEGIAGAGTLTTLTYKALSTGNTILDIYYHAPGTPLDANDVYNVSVTSTSSLGSIVEPMMMIMMMGMMGGMMRGMATS
jgi:hypothetical protein